MKMFGIDKYFFQDCARETLTSKTAEAAIGAAMAQSLFLVSGVFSPRTAATAGIMCVAGHIVARAQARSQAGSGPGGVS
jgi:hypothetical protein